MSEKEVTMNKLFIKDNMSDNEIRVLGTAGNGGTSVTDNKGNKEKQSRKAPSWVWLVAIAVLVGILLIWLFLRHYTAPSDESPVGTVPSDTLSLETVKDSIGQGAPYVAVDDTVINDIPLRILTPLGGHMELYVGHHPDKERNVILAAHAADLREDDGNPAGAFVWQGKLLAKGRSKYGFCAIIDGKVSIGRQKETPLFERAIEQNGCFFRQYSIVSNGKLVPIPPKGKSVRRALCLKDSIFRIVESKTPESYHDFALALEDFGVSEALAIVGSRAAVIWRDKDGTMNLEGLKFGSAFPMENYILWRTRE